MNKEQKDFINKRYEKSLQKGERFWPDSIYKDLLVALAILIILFLLATFIGVPVEPKADPSDTSYVPRPEWYFLFLFKFLALYILIWANKNFNEKFDGIVYAVFISLGFALVENVIYVILGGFEVGLVRALTAVPAHALFGIVMGYYFGLARFLEGQQTVYMVRALMWPIILHGFYDYSLMSQIPILMILFVPFIIYLWITGFKKMKEIPPNDARFLPE